MRRHPHLLQHSQCDGHTQNPVFRRVCGLFHVLRQVLPQASSKYQNKETRKKVLQLCYIWFWLQENEPRLVESVSSDVGNVQLSSYTLQIMTELQISFWAVSEACVCVPNCTIQHFTVYQENILRSCSDQWLRNHRICVSLL